MKSGRYRQVISKAPKKRPRYETPADRKRENAFREKMGRLWGCQIIKLPYKDWVDCIALKKGEVTFILEIKCRTNSMKEYSTYMLSAGKIAHGLMYANLARVHFILAVQFTDAEMFCDITSLDASMEKIIKYGVGGRTDRGDPQDIEMVGYIPMDRFSPVRSRL